MDGSSLPCIVSGGAIVDLAVPVRLQFVQIDPFPRQPPGPLRTQIAQENISAEIDLRLIALILSMDVGRWLIIVIHSNDDPEKARDFRHGVVLDVGRFSAK